MLKAVSEDAGAVEADRICLRRDPTTGKEQSVVSVMSTQSWNKQTPSSRLHVLGETNLSIRLDLQNGEHWSKVEACIDVSLVRLLKL